MDYKAYWLITARIEMSKEEGGLVWHTTKHIPDFFLSENQYGIMGPPSAIEVARRIIDPLGTLGDNLVIEAFYRRS